MVSYKIPVLAASVVVVDAIKLLVGFQQSADCIDMPRPRCIYQSAGMQLLTALIRQSGSMWRPSLAATAFCYAESRLRFTSALVSVKLFYTFIGSHCRKRVAAFATPPI